MSAVLERIENLDRSIILAREKDIRFYGRGAPTLGSEAQNARKEPDEFYNIEAIRSS
ncbi:MAG: hypothetical protein SW833_12920 [Cyanobacteriota bacterium]|nr:hypothetical protein [Cyanobacteriota bacterium]